ncbi:MAG: alpha/beta hydrolase family protein, partial [Thermodesulfobacteriota bacterium]
MKLFPSKKRLLPFLLGFGLLILIVNWGEPAYRTGYVISNVVPNAPRLFEWGKYDVKLMQVDLSLRKGDTQAQDVIATNKFIHIYLPEGINRPAFVILVPGLTPEGALDHRLVALAKAFAGAGIGVATVDSDTIRERRFSRQDIDLIKRTFSFLQDKDYVDKERIGICGFSVAGSYALRAASELGNGPLFVFSLGGYFDLGGLIAEILSKKANYKGSIRPWEPNPMPREVISDNFIVHLGDDDAEQVRSGNPSYYDATKYVQSLPREILLSLDSLSPYPALSRMKT